MFAGVNNGEMERDRAQVQRLFFKNKNGSGVTKIVLLHGGKKTLKRAKTDDSE